MQRAYVAALYPCDNGAHYTIRYLDFGDHEGSDVQPEGIRNVEQLQVGLQKLVDEMQATSQTLPEPALTTDDNWQSSGSVGVVHYVTLTVNIRQ